MRPSNAVLAAPLRTVAAVFASSGVSSLPVLDAQQRYLGVLTAHEIMDAVASGEATDVGSLCSPVEPATPATSLATVLRQLDRGADAVPVADERGSLTGWVRPGDVLAALAGRPA